MLEIILLGLSAAIIFIFGLIIVLYLLAEGRHFWRYMIISMLTIFIPVLIILDLSCEITRPQQERCTQLCKSLPVYSCDKQNGKVVAQCLEGVITRKEK